MKKIIFLLLLLLTLINCRYDRVYHNRHYRYKIKYPEGWIALNSGHDKIKEEEFKTKIDNESIIASYKNVDVAFYNPESKPPIFEQITINAEGHRIDFDDLEGSMEALKHIYTVQLIQKFGNAKLIKSDIRDFKRGKSFVFEFIFQYKNIKYFATYMIIPGKLFATYYFSTICRLDNKDTFQQIADKVINSFQKY